eukprot:5471-Heterococcus_DN1.PRE.2
MHTQYHTAYKQEHRVLQSVPERAGQATAQVYRSYYSNAFTSVTVIAALCLQSMYREHCKLQAVVSTDAALAVCDCMKNYTDTLL